MKKVLFGLLFGFLSLNAMAKNCEWADYNAPGWFDRLKSKRFENICALPTLLGEVSKENFLMRGRHAAEMRSLVARLELFKLRVKASPKVGDLETLQGMLAKVRRFKASPGLSVLKKSVRAQLIELHSWLLFEMSPHGNLR